MTVITLRNGKNIELVWSFLILQYLEDYEDIADAVNYGYYSKNNDNEKDKDDFEIGL